MITEPRDYQLDAVKKIFRELSYRKSTLRVAATGTGKTHEQAMAARVHLATGGDRVLHTAPRGELLQQAAGKYLEWMPWLKPGIDIGFEMGPRRAHGGQRIILGSLGSLHDGRLAQVPKPDLLVIDECHLAIDSVKRLRDMFSDAKMVGWTATPDRLDAQRLLPHIFESVAAKYELGQAIADGYLVPFEFHRAVTHSIQLDHVATAADGDYEEEALAREMMRPRNLHAVANVTHARMEDRPTLVFAVNREHAAALASTFNHYEPGSARAVDGTMTIAERAEILEAHRLGKFKILISVIILTYGVDMPWLAHCVMARPTLSRNLYSQMIGRVLRLASNCRNITESIAAGKRNALVTDLVGNSDMHNLVTPEEALGFDDDALHEFEPEPEEEEEEPEPTEQEQAIEAELIEQRPPKIDGRAEVAFELVPVLNQLAIVGIDIEPAGPNARPATGEQLDKLEKLGLQVAALLTTEQAAQVLSALDERRRNGWCTLKQARSLQSYGLNPNVTFEVAKWAMDRLQSAGWKMTQALSLEFEKKRLIYRGTRTLVLGGGKRRRVARRRTR